MAASLSFEGRGVALPVVGEGVGGSDFVFDQWCTVFRAFPDVDVGRFPFGRDLPAELAASEGEIGPMAARVWECLSVALRRLPDLRGAVEENLLADAAQFVSRMRLRASIVADMADLLPQGDPEVFCSAIGRAVCVIEAEDGFSTGELWKPRMRAALTHVMADRAAYDAQESLGFREQAAVAAEDAVRRAVLDAGGLLATVGKEAARAITVVEFGSVVVLGKGSANLLDLVGSGSGWRDKPVIPFDFYDFVVKGGFELEVGGTGTLDLLVRAPPAAAGCVTAAGRGGELRPCELETDGELYLPFADTIYNFKWAVEVVLPLLASRDLMFVPGYCYLKLFPPDARLMAARQLLAEPTVRSVEGLLTVNGLRQWCGVKAEVSGHVTVSHVLTEGVMPEGLWPATVLAGESARFVQFPATPVAGVAKHSSILKKGNVEQRAMEAKPDRVSSVVASYYDPEVFSALGSSFGFGTESRGFPRSNSSSALLAGGRLEVQTGHRRHVSSTSVDARDVVSPSADQATLRALAQGFFEDLGMEASSKPRPSVGFSTVVAVGQSVSEWAGRDDLRRDTQRMRDVELRMQSGSFLSKDYWKSVARRHSSGRSRPELGLPRGRALHVGDLFAPTTVTSSLDWVLDEAFAVPGWSTYRFKFNAGEQIVTFVPPVTVARDVRMDWDGSETSLVLAGGVRMPAEATVLWFSYAITLTVTGAKSSVVRVSVPVRGMAEALGSSARRFAYIDEVVAVSDFDRLMALDSAVSELGLRPRWRGAAGAARYYAKATYDSAANPYKLRLVPREGGDLEAAVGGFPDGFAMVGFRSTVEGALTEVRVAGVTFAAGKTGKVVLVTDQWNVGFAVKIVAMTTLKVSFVYITDPYAFERNYMDLSLETPTSV